MYPHCEYKTHFHINLCRSTVDMWRKNGIDAGCQKIYYNDDEEDDDDDGNTSANVTVTKKIVCWLLKQRENNSRWMRKACKITLNHLNNQGEVFKLVRKCLLRAVTTITYIITESWFIICCLARWHHQLNREDSKVGVWQCI